MKYFSAAMLSAFAFGTLVAVGYGHGFVSAPRSRGALYSQRPLPQLADAKSVEWSYCPHCQNGGGVDVLKNIAGNVVNSNYVSYKPLEGMFRNGVSVCGDPTGNNDHSATGRFKAPASIPTVAEYQAGGIANFEYDFTTPHGGYLQFYLCDVSDSGDVSEDSFTSGKCYLLERAPNSDCDSGTDSECGPIDPEFTSRWYLPCRKSSSRDQDQIIGGSNGKMSFKIPDVAMEKAVIQAYWLTANSCTPDGLKEYFTSGLWKAVEDSQCEGDGGTRGGFRADHTGTCTTQDGKFPEEFWNCADVKILGGSSSPSTSTVAPQSPPSQDQEKDTAESEEASTEDAQSPDSSAPVSEGSEEASTEDAQSPDSSAPVSDGGGDTDATDEVAAGPTSHATTSETTTTTTQVGTSEESVESTQSPTVSAPASDGHSHNRYGYYGGYHGRYHGSSNGRATSGNTNYLTKSESDSLRPGCMPKIDQTRTDSGYLEYVKQLENYCKQ